jgi:hypothetical protein
VQTILRPLVSRNQRPVLNVLSSKLMYIVRYDKLVFKANLKTVLLLSLAFNEKASTTKLLGWYWFEGWNTLLDPI